MTYQEFIQTKLNAIAEASDAKYMNGAITFYVHANEGEFRAKTAKTQRTTSKEIINCMLLDESTMPIAVKGLQAYEKKQTLEVAVPVDLTSRDYDTGIYTGGVKYVQEILDVFSRSLIGETGTVTVDGQECPFVMAVSQPYTGTEATYPKIGKCVPFSIEIVWQIFTDGVFGNNVHISLALPGSDEFIETIKLDGKVLRTRSGDTSQYATNDQTNQNSNQELKTSILQQALILTVQVPYKNTAVPIQLVRDMWKGNLKRVYRVRQYDGVAFTEDAPFEAEMVANEIQMPMTAGTPLTITVTLTISAEDEEDA